MERCGYLKVAHSLSRFVEQRNWKHDDLLMCIVLLGGYLANVGSGRADRYLVNCVNDNCILYGCNTVCKISRFLIPLYCESLHLTAAAAVVAVTGDAALLQSVAIAGSDRRSPYTVTECIIKWTVWMKERMLLSIHISTHVCQPFVSPASHLLLTFPPKKRTEVFEAVGNKIFIAIVRV